MPGPKNGASAFGVAALRGQRQNPSNPHDRRDVLARFVACCRQ
jgi:hypothetical protein